jgi:hypothetical protein
MSNILIALSDRLNTPPTSPLHPSSPSAPPPSRLLILSSSASLANRLTTVLLPFYRAVYPPYRHPKRVLPKPPKLHILPFKPRSNSSNSSYSTYSSLPRESSKNVDFSRRATHPPINSRGDTWKSPPTLSTSQTPGGGNPSSVSSWFGSWVRRGGPLAASNFGPNQGESCSPLSSRPPDFRKDSHHRESDSDISPPDIDIIKDATGEVIDIKLATSFRTSQRLSSGTQSDDYDLKRQGSMSLNNVTFIEDVFRVTGFHGGGYHVDYHLQSMERTDEVEADVLRVLKEDILFFFTPPVHAIPVNPSRSPEPPRLPQGQKKVSCVIADIDALEIYQLTVHIEEEDEQHERDILGPKDDRQWQRVQEWAMHGTTGIEEMVKEILL